MTSIESAPTIQPQSARDANVKDDELQDSLLDIPDQEDAEMDDGVDAPVTSSTDSRNDTNVNDHDNTDVTTAAAAVGNSISDEKNGSLASSSAAHALNGSLSVADVVGSIDNSSDPSSHDPATSGNDPLNTATINGSALSIAPGSLAGTGPDTPVNGNGSTRNQSPTPVGPGTNGKQGSVAASAPKRIDVDDIMTNFQKKLGKNWERYRTAITYFLIGKLTRPELHEELSDFLDPSTIHLHNHFLLANLTNALRDAPQGEGGVLTGWSSKNRDNHRNVKGDSQLAKLKEDIMGLSVRERRRIKAIAKESGKRAPIPSTITATRQAMLPKIPFVNDREKLQQLQQQAQQPTTDVGVAKSIGTPAVWTQNIIHAYEAPLASETFELPDNESLSTRMLGISLEHGLLQGVSSESASVMVCGLEIYLKGIIEQMVDRAKIRRKEHEKITLEDAAMVLEAAPSGFVEYSGPLYRLKNVMLHDDDDELPVENSTMTNGKAAQVKPQISAATAVSASAAKNSPNPPSSSLPAATKGPISDRGAVKNLLKELLASS